MISGFKDNSFLFTELVKRDFKKKYKRTYLGVLWSLFSPMLTLLVMRVVFTHFFGRDITHYTTYLFCGNIIFAYFADASSGGMTSLLDNSPIFSKINVPKHLFLFSRNVSSLINFSLTFLIFLIFTAIDGISITPRFLMLLFPIVCMIIFNLGIGLILSALYVFFRDMQYLWGIFTQLLMYVSAIFYDTAELPTALRSAFYMNPIFVYIKYFRTIVLEGEIPSLELHALALIYAAVAFTVGAIIYKRYNHKFLYYV